MSTISPRSPELPESPAAMRLALLKRLNRFRRRVRLHLVMEGLALCVAALLGFVLASLLLDVLLRLSLPVRIVLALLALAGLGYLFYRYVLAPLRAVADPIDLAQTLDQKGPRARGQGPGEENKTERQLDPSFSGRLSGGAGAPPPPEARRDKPTSGGAMAHDALLPGAFLIAPRVATVLQLPDLPQTDRAASPAMIGLAVARSYRALQDIDFLQRLDQRRLRLALAAIALCLILPAILAAIRPDAASLWFARWVLGSNQPWPQDTYLAVDGVEDGRLVVPRGEPYVLRVHATDASSVIPETVTIRYAQQDQETVEDALARFGANDFRYDFPPVGLPIELTLRGGDDAIGPIILDPVERPRIVGLDLLTQGPGDPEPVRHAFDAGGGHLAFLPDTRITLTVTASVPVREAQLETQAEGVASFERVDEAAFQTSWTHQAPVQLRIVMVEAKAGLASRPLPLAIGLREDRPPRVNLRITGVRQRITPAASVPISLQARDDFGLASLALRLRGETPAPPSATGGLPASAPPDANDQPPQPLDRTQDLAAFDQPDQLQVEHEHLLSVKAMELPVGTLLHITGQATDASYAGAQTGESRAMVLRLVEPEELMREVMLRLQTQRGELRQAVVAAGRMADQLAILTTAEEAQPLLRQHRLLERQVLRIANILEATITEMRLNELGSAQANDLLAYTVHQPMVELHQGLMAQQRRRFEGLSRQVEAGALQAAIEGQKATVAELERLVRQMDQWDSFVDVINQLNEVIKLQEGVHEGTTGIKRQDVEELFAD